MPEQHGMRARSITMTAPSWAVHDGAGGYRIACHIDISVGNGGITITGRIDGTPLPVTTP
jgi:hypothetical protein